MADNKKILVLQRGWVVTGRVEQVGDEVVVFDAKVIRRWGTTKGIGQLALEGAQPNTVLDKAGTVRVHQLAIVLTIDIAEGVEL